MATSTTPLAESLVCSKSFPHRVGSTTSKKRISRAYMRRAEENPDRLRKDGTPVYSQSLDMISRRFTNDNRHAHNNSCEECARTAFRSRHGASARKAASYEVLEETSVAYAPDVQLPSDRMREKTTAAAVSGLKLLQLQIDKPLCDDDALIASITASMYADGDMASAAALRDLRLADDTSAARSSDFNFNYIVPAGPEFVVKPSKNKKKARKAKAKAKAKAQSLAAAAASHQVSADGDNNNMAPADAAAAAESMALVPFRLFNWDAWCAAVMGTTTSEPAVGHVCPHGVPEFVSDHSSEDEEDWDVLSTTRFDEDDEADRAAAVDGGRAAAPWVVLGADL